MQIFQINLDHTKLSCKSVRVCVKLTARWETSFPCIQSKNSRSHMTSRASRIRELANPNLSAGSRAELCCGLARDFENRGEYDEACEVLSVFWPRIGERPKLEGLERSIAAEVLMRAGVLTGIIGSNRQITNAQEIAKNLITESLNLFQAQRFKTKVAEAQTELALCYWRTGEYNNASDLLKLALEQVTTDSELKVKAIIRKAI